MKILHVLHRFGSDLHGGTERTTAALARAMQRAGHEVGIVCGTLEGGPSHRLERSEVDGLPLCTLRRQDLHFESWEKAWCPDVSNAFRRLLIDERPDVVHVHHWLRLSSELVRIAQKVGVGVVATTLHDHWTMLATPPRAWGHDVPEPPPGPAWANDSERKEAFAMHRDDMLDEIRAAHLRFVPSAAHAASLQAMAPGPLGPLLPELLPNLALPARRPDSSAPRGKRLLFWGSLYPDKGLDTVLDALFSVGNGWELHVYGAASDPEYGARLHRRSANMPVQFHGRFDSGDLVAAEADYAVLPSTCHESYGLVLDEARALGLPTLAADIPAFREHCDTAATAWFEPGDPGSLAMLLLDEARLASLQRPAIPTGLPDADQAAARLLEHYASAARGEHGPHQAPPALPERRRAAVLFRRAERRLWSLLQQGEPPRKPPEGWL